jgi:hypothetical protein
LIVGKIGLISLINKTLSGFFGGLLLGFFLLGIMVPRANSSGALIGGAVGFTLSCAVSLQTSLNFLWYAPVGCMATLVFGILASHLWPSPPENKVRGLTLASDVRQYRPALSNHRVSHTGRASMRVRFSRRPVSAAIPTDEPSVKDRVCERFVMVKG